MKIRLSGRTKESAAAIQELADFLERFGEVKEIRENILVVDDREAVLVAFSAQSYYERKGYYWFSALCPTHHCMMDLGVLAIGPSNLVVQSISEQEASRGQRIALRREHGLNQKYLRFHLDNIYVGSQGASEIPLSSAYQAI